MKATEANTIDQYIDTFPKETQLILEQMRAIIRKAAPKAEEVISYKMPAFKQGEVLVYFAGYKKHIGFYPTGSGIAAFKKEISAYKNSKGAVQFSLDDKLPAALISKMVKFRIKDAAERTKAKLKKK